MHGFGGSSIGYKYLLADTMLYIVAGGEGIGGYGLPSCGGGFNGGGSVGYVNGATTSYHHGSGGGATHIALIDRNA